MHILLNQVVSLAKEAGQGILYYYGKHQELALTLKADKSPLTAADRAAHQIISAGLSRLSDFPILSEEGEIPPYRIRQPWSSYWLVDPLDGTRGFVQGSAEFSVNIALIEKGRPILGVIYAPITKVCYYAAQGIGAFKQMNAEESVLITASLFNPKDYRLLLGSHPGKSKLLQMFAKESCQVMRLNSSLKFGWLAEGQADVYPRLGQTGEWDTAAGQCILEQAGGCVVNLEGQPLRYNAKASLINPAFVALGDPSQSFQMRQFILSVRRNL